MMTRGRWRSIKNQETQGWQKIVIRMAEASEKKGVQGKKDHLKKEGAFSNGKKGAKTKCPGRKVVSAPGGLGGNGMVGGERGAILHWKKSVVVEGEWLVGRDGKFEVEIHGRGT